MFTKKFLIINQKNCVFLYVTFFQICSDIFGSEVEVERHMGIHDKRYMCNVCNKTFCNKTSLQNHKYIHKGMRPYTCR